MDEYINSFIDTEKNKGTLSECFGTFKAYLGDVPGNIVLNYKRPKFHDEVEAERKLEERFEKLAKEQEEYFKNRCKTCYREFISYENLWRFSLSCAKLCKAIAKTLPINEESEKLISDFLNKAYKSKKSEIIKEK